MRSASGVDVEVALFPFDAVVATRRADARGAAVLDVNEDAQVSARPAPAQAMPTPTAAPAKEFAELEARFLREALERNRWNRQLTADELGIHKTTLLRRVRRLGLQLPKIDGRSTRTKTGK